MLGADLLRFQIAEDFAAISTDLFKIIPPDGHQWRAAGSELTWFAGDVLASTRYGASIFLRRTPCDDRDTSQLHIEVRLFWEQNADPAGPSGAMRAILWAERGERIAFRSRLLLGEPARFVRGADRDALLIEVRSYLHAALAEYGARQEHCGPN